MDDTGIMCTSGCIKSPDIYLFSVDMCVSICRNNFLDHRKYHVSSTYLFVTHVIDIQLEGTCQINESLDFLLKEKKGKLLCNETE